MRLNNSVDCTTSYKSLITWHEQADVDIAVAAARSAFNYGSEWRTMNASNRGRLMYKWADAIERDIHYIAVSHWVYQK